MLTEDAKLDLAMWDTFLRSYNGITFFRALNLIDNRVINLQADACKRGYGATYGTKWIQAKYPTAWQQFNIAILEFFPIIVLMEMFGHKFKNSVVLFHSDNEAVCNIIKHLTSKDKIIQIFLRKLLLKLLKLNVDLRSRHVPGKQNVLCDRISRFQVTPELLQSHKMDDSPTEIPAHLQPESFALDGTDC